MAEASEHGPDQSLFEPTGGIRTGDDSRGFLGQPRSLGVKPLQRTALESFLGLPSRRRRMCGREFAGYS
jgi:hypothetical protein